MARQWYLPGFGQIKEDGTLLWKLGDQQRILDKLLGSGEAMSKGEMLFLSFVKHGAEYNRSITNIQQRE